MLSLSPIQLAVPRSSHDARMADADEAAFSAAAAAAVVTPISPAAVAPVLRASVVRPAAVSARKRRSPAPPRVPVSSSSAPPAHRHTSNTTSSSSAARRTMRPPPVHLDIDEEEHVENSEEGVKRARRLDFFATAAVTASAAPIVPAVIELLLQRDGAPAPVPSPAPVQLESLPLQLTPFAGFGGAASTTAVVAAAAPLAPAIAELYHATDTSFVPSLSYEAADVDFGFRPLSQAADEEEDDAESSTSSFRPLAVPAALQPAETNASVELEASTCLSLSLSLPMPNDHTTALLPSLPPPQPLQQHPPRPLPIAASHFSPSLNAVIPATPTSPPLPPSSFPSSQGQEVLFPAAPAPPDNNDDDDRGDEGDESLPDSQRLHLEPLSQEVRSIDVSPALPTLASKADTTAATSAFEALPRPAAVSAAPVPLPVLRPLPLPLPPLPLPLPSLASSTRDSESPEPHHHHFHHDLARQQQESSQAHSILSFSAGVNSAPPQQSPLPPTTSSAVASPALGAVAVGSSHTSISLSLAPSQSNQRDEPSLVSLSQPSIAPSGDATTSSQQQQQQQNYEQHSMAMEDETSFHLPSQLFGAAPPPLRTHHGTGYPSLPLPLPLPPASQQSSLLRHVLGSAAASLAPSQAASLPFRISPLAQFPAHHAAPSVAASSSAALPMPNHHPAASLSYNPWTLLAPLLCSGSPPTSAPSSFSSRSLQPQQHQQQYQQPQAELQQHLSSLASIDPSYPAWIARCETVLLLLAKHRMGLQRFTHLSFLHCMLVRGEFSADQLPPFDVPSSAYPAPSAAAAAGPAASLPPTSQAQQRTYGAPFTLYSSSLNPRPLVPGVPPAIWKWLRGVDVHQLGRRGAAQIQQQQQFRLQQQQQQQQQAQPAQQQRGVFSSSAAAAATVAAAATGSTLRCGRPPRPPVQPPPLPLPLPLPMPSFSQDTDAS